MHKVNPYLITPNHPITVTVIGCGGTGSRLLGKLASLNASLKLSGHRGLHVVAVDGDRVTESNCGRQMFYPSDINRFKAAVLIERINRCFGFNWESLNEYIFDIPKRNITFICVDSLSVRKNLYKTNMKLNRYSDERAKRMYIIDCGNTYNSGQVVIYSPNSDLKSVVELFGDAEVADAKKPSCSMFINLREQSLFINDIVATVAVNSLYELIAEMQLDYNGIMIDLKTFKFIKIPIHETKVPTGSAEGDQQGVPQDPNATNP